MNIKSVNSMCITQDITTSFQINAAYEITLESIEMTFGDKDKIASLNGLRVKKYNRTRLVISNHK